MAEEQTPAPEPVYRQFWVKSTDPTKCGCWDVHPQHPGGEVFVSGTEAALVAGTPIVMDAMAKGRLVEASGPEGEPPKKGALDVPPPAAGSPAVPAIGGVAPADAAETKRKS